MPSSPRNKATNALTHSRLGSDRQAGPAWTLILILAGAKAETPAGLRCRGQLLDTTFIGPLPCPGGILRMITSVPGRKANFAEKIPPLFPAREPYPDQKGPRVSREGENLLITGAP